MFSNLYRCGGSVGDAFRRPPSRRRGFSRIRRRSFGVGAERLESRHMLAGDIVISEILASNRDGLRDEFGGSSDWIELFNQSDATVNLGGWHLTDDSDNLAKWEFPDRDLPSKEILVIFASGLDRLGDTLHTNFKLSKSGEYLALVQPDGVTVSYHFMPAYPPQLTNVSYGIVDLDGDTASVGYFETVTPDARNARPLVDRVQFSTGSGTFTEPFELNLWTDDPSATVRYTTDRTIPTSSSPVFSEPILVDKTTQVRVRAFAIGKAPSPVATHAYIQIAPSLATFETTGFQSNLPLIVVDSFGNEAVAPEGRAHDADKRFHPAALFVYDTDATGKSSLLNEPDLALTSGIHRRGQSSLNARKGSFAVELWDESIDFDATVEGSEGPDLDVSILGLPAESDWVLQGPYTDHSQLNNYLAFALYRSVGLEAPRTRLIELFVNADGSPLDYETDYRGTYVLMEKIKIGKNRIDIDPANGEVIFKNDLAGDEAPLETGISELENMRFHDPEFPGSGQISRLRNRILDFHNAINGPAIGESGYAAYIDVDSFIDHLLLSELALESDRYQKSDFYFINREGKIERGPAWDFNWAFGVFANGCADLDGWGERLDVWYRRLLGDSDFDTRMRERWFELRSQELAWSTIEATIDQAVLQLTNGRPIDDIPEPDEPSIPISRNFERWGLLEGWQCQSDPLPESQSLDGNPDSYDDAIFILKRAVSYRLTWIDAFMGKTIPGDANLDGQVDAMDLQTVTENLFDLHWRDGGEIKTWQHGDFTGDDVVDVSDFNVWNENKFRSAASATLNQNPVRTPQAAFADP